MQDRLQDVRVAAGGDLLEEAPGHDLATDAGVGTRDDVQVFVTVFEEALRTGWGPEVVAEQVVDGFPRLLFDGITAPTARRASTRATARRPAATKATTPARRTGSTRSS